RGPESDVIDKAAICQLDLVAPDDVKDGLPAGLEPKNWEVERGHRPAPHILNLFLELRRLFDVVLLDRVVIERR
ncbi:MAG: hypothetical protein VX107_00115, partial [Pseudomonadota bacterium]|nr:hypothetical protein [Pseudomonadota bacterium]